MDKPNNKGQRLPEVPKKKGAWPKGGAIQAGFRFNALGDGSCDAVSGSTLVLSE